MPIKISPLQQGPQYTGKHPFVTGGSAGKDRFGLDVLPKEAQLVNSFTIGTLVNSQVTLEGIKRSLWKITRAVHQVKDHYFLRITSGVHDGDETPIFSVLDANNFYIHGPDHLPGLLSTDTVEVYRLVTVVSSAGPSGVAIEVKPSGLVKVNEPVIHDYDTDGNVATGAYTEMVAALAGQARQVKVFDSSGSAIFLAIGPAASEDDIVIIPPGGDSFDILIPAGSRVAIKAADVLAASGKIIINFLG